MNTIKTALRSFRFYRVYTSINIIGLVLGFSFALVLLMYVQFEFSLDKFHIDKDQIFRVNSISTTPKSTGIYPAVRVPYGPALISEIPEFKSYIRIKSVRGVDKCPVTIELN